MVFHLPYRELEELARGLKKLIGIPAPDYSTLNLRLPKIDLASNSEPEEGEPIAIAVNATGIKVTHRGEWMGKKRKGSVKIHVEVDVVTKQVVSVEVSDEGSHDDEKFVPLVLGDGGYDRRYNFEFLASKGIEAGIKVRENSHPQSEGARGEVVRAYLADPEGWKQSVGYGRRWMAETFFSGFKRLFGEVVQAKRFERIVAELKLEVWV